jgi:hypothetical protein
MSSVVYSCGQVVKDTVFPRETESLIVDDDGYEGFERSA